VEGDPLERPVITYLRIIGCPVGLLINFNSNTLMSGVKRLLHPLKKL
jgi:hypothetical protein